MWIYGNKDFSELINEIETNLKDLKSNTEFHNLEKSSNINYYNQLITMNLIIKGILQDREVKTI